MRTGGEGPKLKRFRWQGRLASTGIGRSRHNLKRWREQADVKAEESATMPLRAKSKRRSRSRETVYERESLWPSSYALTDNPDAARAREDNYIQMLNERRRRRVLIPGTDPMPPADVRSQEQGRNR